MQIIRVKDRTEAGHIAAALFAAEAALGRGLIAIPGGSSVAEPLRSLSSYPSDVLDQLDVRIADERVFGEKNEDIIRENLIEPAAARGIDVTFRTPLREGSREEIVGSYRETIPETFDAVLLSSGEDGHVLGLFPGHQQLDSENRVEDFDESPKPPPVRMTSTFRCYDPESTLAVLLFLGEGKREAFEKFMEQPDHHEIPAAWFWRFKRAVGITDLS